MYTCVSSAYECPTSPALAMILNNSAVYNRNRSGPRTEPCGRIATRRRSIAVHCSRPAECDRGGTTEATIAPLHGYRTTAALVVTVSHHILNIIYRRTAMRTVITQLDHQALNSEDQIIGLCGTYTEKIGILQRYEASRGFSATALYCKLHLTAQLPVSLH